MNKILSGAIVSFVRRKFLLILLACAAVWAASKDQLFAMVGSLLYLLPRALWAAVVMFLIRDIAFTVFRAYVDPRGDQEDFRTDWAKISPEARVFASILVSIGIFLGVCHLAKDLWVSSQSVKAPPYETVESNQ